MFLSRNKKNNVYPCKPQFYYIKVGLRGSELYRRVFVMYTNVHMIHTINWKIKTIENTVIYFILFVVFQCEKVIGHVFAPDTCSRYVNTLCELQCENGYIMAPNTTTVSRHCTNLGWEDASTISDMCIGKCFIPYMLGKIQQITFYSSFFFTFSQKIGSDISCLLSSYEMSSFIFWEIYEKYHQCVICCI